MHVFGVWEETHYGLWETIQTLQSKNFYENFTFVCFFPFSFDKLVSVEQCCSENQTKETPVATQLSFTL